MEGEFGVGCGGEECCGTTTTTTSSRSRMVNNKMENGILMPNRSVRDLGEMGNVGGSASSRGGGFSFLCVGRSGAHRGGGGGRWIGRVPSRFADVLRASIYLPILD